jgi:hypothetical protein
VNETYTILIIRDPIHPDFPGTVPVLWILQIFVLVSQQIQFGMPNVPVLQIIKLGIPDVPILGAVFCAPPVYMTVHTFALLFVTFGLH